MQLTKTFDQLVSLMISYTVKDINSNSVQCFLTLISTLTINFKYAYNEYLSTATILDGIINKKPTRWSKT